MRFSVFMMAMAVVFFLAIHLPSHSSLPTGSTVAKFAGKNVHKRLLAEETYRQKRYDEAMKRAFLGTDEDLLAGTSLHHRLGTVITSNLKDPAHTRDPSGCTAVAALLTHDKKIYVVCRHLIPSSYLSFNTSFRLMRVTRGRSSVSKG